MRLKITEDEMMFAKELALANLMAKYPEHIDYILAHPDFYINGDTYRTIRYDMFKMKIGSPIPLRLQYKSK